MPATSSTLVSNSSIMKKTLKIIWLSAICVISSTVFSSCSQRQEETLTRTEYVEYLFGCDSSEDTKSAYFDDGEAVSNYCLFFYMEDKLRYSFYSEDGGILKVQFLQSDIDSEMMVYALANVGNHLQDFPMESESSLLTNYRQSFASMSTLDGVPASYMPDSPVVPSADLDGHVTILPAVPMMARFNIDLSVSNAEYPGNLTVRSLRCFNVNKEVSAFGSGDAATEVTDQGDYLTLSSDIPVLADGGMVSFYVPENMQGSIENPSMDYKQKTPPNELCTYVMVEAEYSSDVALYGLHYVFYLGEDLYTSFDIERNRVYDLHLNLELSDAYLFGYEDKEPESHTPDQGAYVRRLEEIRYRLVAYYEGSPATVIGCNTDDEIKLEFKIAGDLYKEGQLFQRDWKEISLDWNDINWDNEDEWQILQLTEFTGHECITVNSEGDELCKISTEYKGNTLSDHFEIRSTDGHVRIGALESEDDLLITVYNNYRHRPISVDLSVDVKITGRADKTSDLSDIYMEPHYEYETFHWDGHADVAADAISEALSMEGKIKEIADLIRSRYIICDSDANGDELPDYGGWAVFYRFHILEIEIKATSTEGTLNIRCEPVFKEISNDSYWTPMTLGVNTVYDEADPAVWSSLVPKF